MEKVGKIAVGVMCNGTVFQQWQAKCLLALQTDPRFEIKLLIVNGTSSTQPTFLQKFSGPFFYRQFENRWLKSAARKPIFLDAELGSVPKVIYRVNRKGRFSEYFADADVETIKSHQLDFIIRFGFGIIRGEVLNSAKWGVWSFHHGNPEEYRGGPAGFWELIHRKPATGTILQRLTEKLDLGVVLHQGTFPTVFHSYGEQLDQLLMGSANWVKTTALQCASGNIDPAKGIATLTKKGHLYKFPTNLGFLYFLVRLAWNKVFFYRTKYFFRDLWLFGVTELTPQELLTTTSFDKINWAPKPKHSWHYKADCFATPTTDGLAIYFENYSYRQQKATIQSTCYSPKTGLFSEDSLVLAPKHHLSYPFVFQWQNETYLLPEAWQSKKLTLYRVDKAGCIAVADLLSDFKAVDPTLVHFQNRFWLFCTEKSAASHQLYIFYAENLTGPYQPHTLNPVKTAVESSRAAGTIFQLGDSLYRPAQKCSHTYGGSVVINKILELTTETYSEIVVNEIFPNPKWQYNKGLHTISVVNNLVVFDAKKEEFNFNPKGN